MWLQAQYGHRDRDVQLSFLTSDVGGVQCELAYSGKLPTTVVDKWRKTATSSVGALRLKYNYSWLKKIRCTERVM